MSTQSFAELGVSDVVVRALARRGFNQPFEIQRLVIGDLLAGRVRCPSGERFRLGRLLAQ